MACRIACEFDGLIPDSETPEHTEGYEGFYHLIEMKGDVERMDLDYIIRDHDLALAHARAEHMHRIAEFLNSKYGEGTVEVSIEESYRNMIEIINEHPRLLELPIQILKDMGVEADTSPIRGGTDGATLSFIRVCPVPILVLVAITSTVAKSSRLFSRWTPLLSYSSAWFKQLPMNPRLYSRFARKKFISSYLFVS